MKTVDETRNPSGLDLPDAGGERSRRGRDRGRHQRDPRGAARVPVTTRLGGETTIDDAGADAFTRLAPNAPDERRKDFTLGSRLFAIEWVPFPNAVKIFDGLGPTFNHDACSGCHVANGRGRPPETPGGADGVDAGAAVGGRRRRRRPAPGLWRPAQRPRDSPASHPEGRAIIDIRGNRRAPTVTARPTRCSALGSASPTSPSARSTAR